MGLSTNDKITVENLLYGLLLVSGNDAAVALAEFVGGSVEGFADMMNQKADDLGLTSTHFVTPHGLDKDEHYTTAFELAKIADYALKNEVFSKMVKTSYFTVNIDGNSKSLHNTNELLGYLNGVYGVKTGFTNGANRCLVSSCKRGNLDIICVVLGCDTKKNRTLDSTSLINYVFDNFSVVDLNGIIDGCFDDWMNSKADSIFVNKGTFSNLDLHLDESQILFDTVAVNNDCLDDVTASISFTDFYEAPLIENSVIGYLDLSIGGKSCFRVDILNGNSVKRKDVLFYLKEFFVNYFDYFAA